MRRALIAGEWYEFWARFTEGKLTKLNGYIVMMIQSKEPHTEQRKQMNFLELK